jgi:hypothetical protein
MLSDRQAHRSFIVSCFIDFGCTPCGAHDFDRAPRDTYNSTGTTCDLGVHDSDHASCGTDVPTLPLALLASPSGCVGATRTASTSAVATGKGCTGGTSGQPSSDDHMGEAGLPSTG